MQQRYNYAFFDEASKREIRRALIKGVSIPGYQVPFASREMPIGRGWGTGGLQITTQNKAKGQFAFEFTGHYSIKNPEIVPYELYIKQEIGA